MRTLSETTNAITTPNKSPRSHLWHLFHLVLTRSLLARLELIQVPPANRQAPLVVIHALSELIDVVGACAALLRAHVDLGVLLREVGVLGRVGGGFGRGAAAEPAAYCVADGGADGDTAKK
jgi:hypothetical protein